MNSKERILFTLIEKKALYEQMFNHIFSKINQILDIKNMYNNTSIKNTTVIGVLDIYGFEIFDING
jgi:myosin heavy subunit